MPQATFNGAALKGLVTKFTPGPFENHPYRQHFAGVNGVSELRGGSGLRVIEIRAIVFGSFRTRRQLHVYLNEGVNEDTNIGSNGTLTYTPPAGQGLKISYGDCTFEGFTLDDPPGELFDYAGTLDGGWFASGTFKFTQLSDS